MPTSTHRPSPVDDEFNTPIEEKFDNMSNFNNMSGSYSNLFRERLDDDQIDNTQNVRNRVSQGSLTNLSNDIVENVYCNIPPQFLPPADGQSCSEYSNPNLHVYSNIAASNGPADGVTVVAIVPPANDLTLSRNQIKPDSILHGSSTLLNDDLDLDDPVMAVGSIRQTDKKRALNQIADGSASTAGPKVPISMEMKQVTDSMSAKGDRLAMNSTLGSKSADISSSRMLLHDTTMIDTALDLDSLDGSSLDNSHACLVKKKKVG